MSLAAGQLRHSVTLQKQVTTRDADGAPVTGWQDVVTVWAAIAPLSGREFIAAQATQAAVDARITIRYRAGVDAAMPRV